MSDVPRGMDAKLEDVRQKVDALASTLTKFQFTVNKLARMCIADSEIKVPVDIQDHWCESLTFKASGAVTGNGTGNDIDVGRFVRMMTLINVTAISGKYAKGQGLTVKIKGKDEITGLYKVLADVYCSTVLGPRWIEFDNVPWRIMKVDWTLVGTSSSATFSVTAQAKG